MSETKLRDDYFGYTVTCVKCRRTKKPLGRSSPLGLSLCDDECPGYHIEPLPSNLWPNESEADFGYRVAR